MDIKAIIDADVRRPLALADEKPKWLSWHLGLEGSITVAVRSLQSSTAGTGMEIEVRISPGSSAVK